MHEDYRAFPTNPNEDCEGISTRTYIAAKVLASMSGQAPYWKDPATRKVEYPKIVAAALELTDLLMEALSPAEVREPTP